VILGRDNVFYEVFMLCGKSQEEVDGSGKTHKKLEFYIV